MTGDHTVRIERTFHAPAEAVFDAWTSEEVILRWRRVRARLGDRQAEVDLRVGGAIRVSSTRDPGKDEEYGGGGTYTEIEPPTRLAFTWTWDGDTRETLIRARLPRDRRRHDGQFHPQPLLGRGGQCATTRMAGARSSTDSNAPSVDEPVEQLEASRRDRRCRRSGLRRGRSECRRGGRTCSAPAQRRTRRGR